MQDVVGVLLRKGFGDLGLAEHRVAGDDLARQRQHAQQSQRRLVLVGLGIDAQLPDHGLNRRREHGDQVYRGGLAVVTAPERLAVEGEVVAEVGTALEDPVAEDGLEGLDVDASEDAGVGGDTGRLPAPESEGVCEGGSVVASELSDALEGRAPGEDGDDGQREDGNEVVNPSLATPRVENTLEHLDERPGHGELRFEEAAPYRDPQNPPTSTRK